MLARIYRLTHKADFDLVYRRGRAFFMGPLGIKVMPRIKQPSRFGFVVGTVVDKRAVVRNRIKRVLRDATRNLSSALVKSADVVVLTRPGIEKFTTKQLRETYQTLLKRAGLLR